MSPFAGHPTIDLRDHQRKIEKWWAVAGAMELRPRRILEAGAGVPGSVETHRFIEAGVLVDLYEPQPDVAASLRRVYGQRENVRVRQVALGEREGLVEMRRGLDGPDGLTAMEGVPWIVEANFKFKAVCCPLSSFDAGDYDFAKLDMEGAEVFALRHMVSRPRLIVIEEFRGRSNPFRGELLKIFAERGYVCREAYRGDEIWTTDSS